MKPAAKTTPAKSAPEAQAPRPTGRPTLPPDLLQSATIRERVTEAQAAEYQARGGKAWLLRELGRKARK